MDAKNERVEESVKQMMSERNEVSQVSPGLLKLSGAEHSIAPISDMKCCCSDL